ncbi:MAG: tetratricopeptide repeat protein [Anaerolineae bacterium]
MRRSVALLIAVPVFAVGGFLVSSRDEILHEPELVPAGETVTQTYRDEEGEPQTWKVSKQYIPREELPERVLPSPKPRTALPGQSTESARAVNSWALDAWRTGDILRALELFEVAVDEDPDDPVPHSNYGRLLTLMTAYEKALPHLERAAELTPDDPQVWLDLSTLYERAILLERAFYARQRAEELAEGQKIVRDGRGFWVLEGEVFP